MMRGDIQRGCLMRTIIAAAALTTVLVGAAGAHATSQPFTNGGFEQPGGEVREELSTNTLPGWTASQGSNEAYDIYESDDEGDGLAAAQGTHYVSFGHNGTYGGSISQTFSVAPDTEVNLTYEVAEQQGVDPTQDLYVTLTDGGHTATADNSPLPDAFAPGVPLSIFETSGVVTITFFDATPPGDGGGSNLALDEVEINGSLGATASGAPEPTAWALMIIGLGFAGAGLRGRRQALAATA
jgi:hypothetical protein